MARGGASGSPPVMMLWDLPPVRCDWGQHEPRFPKPLDARPQAGGTLRRRSRPGAGLLRLDGDLGAAGDRRGFASSGTRGGGRALGGRGAGGLAVIGSPVPGRFRRWQFGLDRAVATVAG